MNQQYGQDQDQMNVAGFEVPNSPDANYNNVYHGNEDEERQPPSLPPHLHHTLINHPNPSNGGGSSSLPLPLNVTINHVYIENREGRGSVLGLGVTHRFRSKLVTVVLYKPVARR